MLLIPKIENDQYKFQLYNTIQKAQLVLMDNAKLRKLVDIYLGVYEGQDSCGYGCALKNWGLSNNFQYYEMLGELLQQVLVI